MVRGYHQAGKVFFLPGGFCGPGASRVGKKRLLALPGLGLTDYPPFDKLVLVYTSVNLGAKTGLVSPSW